MGKRHSQLLSDIEAFLEETGMGPVYFGKAAGTSSNLVGNLRNGGRCWEETEEKARAFMAKRRHDMADGNAASPRQGGAS